ncbi:unnamed protein product [Musa acuminata subsp. burmannicoides]
MYHFGKFADTAALNGEFDLCLKKNMLDDAERHKWHKEKEISLYCKQPSTKIFLLSASASFLFNIFLSMTCPLWILCQNSTEMRFPFPFVHDSSERSMFHEPWLLS